MKRRINLLPTPMAGLALAITTLGMSWDYAFDFDGRIRILGALLGGFLLLLIALKFLFSPKALWSDLKHPVIGGVVPTFAMGLMVISYSLGKVFQFAGTALWLFALFVHVAFLLSFLYHRTQNFSLNHMVPSWFVPPVGLMVANVVFSGNENLRLLCNIILFFSMSSCLILMPLMLYRLIFGEQIADNAKPSIAILAAPASLSLAGYLSVVSAPSPLIIAVLLGVSLLMTAVIYVSFFHLLRLPFSPAYAAFTFPMVIGATALYKTADWMKSIGLASVYIEQLQIIAFIELIVATGVVCYVAFHYRRFIFLQWENTKPKGEKN